MGTPKQIIRPHPARTRKCPPKPPQQPKPTARVPQPSAPKTQ